MTSDEAQALRQALTAFANAVTPAAHATHAAADARSEDCRAAFAAAAAAVAALVASATRAAFAALAVCTADTGDSVDAADTVRVATVAGAVAMAAGEAAEAARLAANTMGTSACQPRVVDMARLAAEVAHVVERSGNAAKLVGVVAEAQQATVAAFQYCEQVFGQVTPMRGGADLIGGELRRLGRVPRRLVAVAAATFPAADRVRFREEWVGLLAELPTRRERARQLCSLLTGAPRQSWVLRRPEPGSRRI